MAIKFKCPNCDAGLSVKDDKLAGRKIGCPKCKQLVVIPKPQPAASAAPEEDLDALAMSALVEPKPDAATVEESATIDFECPQCNEPIKMAREFAGKNAPCPECKRIIRVPMPKTKDPADWRQKDTLPSGARRDTEPAPEGAWEPSRAKGVSVEALSQAGVLKKKKKPGLTRRQKITRGLIAGAAAVVVLVGALFAYSAWAHGKQDTLVLAAAADAEKGKSSEAAAEANRAAGEYFIRTDSREAAERAQQRFAKARDLLAKCPADPGRDVLLADLLVSQADLGGTDAEAGRGARLKWKPTLEELQRTLSHATSPAGRLHAIRLLSRKLVAHGQAEDAARLAPQGGGGTKAPESADAEEAGYEGPEALALLGIELFRAKDQKAGQLADRISRTYDQQAGRPQLAPSAVALCVAVGKPPPQPGKDEGDKERFLVGQATGLALKGDVDAARQVKIDKPEGRLRALVAVAEVTGNAADVDAAAGLLDGDLNGKPVPPWLVYRLAAAAAKSGGADRVLKLAERVEDPGLKVMAQLLAVRARLDGSKGAAGDSALEGLDGGPMAQALGRMALARHNGRTDAGALKAAEGWDEAVRPYGILGAVLGAQDSRVK